jgi:hypothetical protein
MLKERKNKKRLKKKGRKNKKKKSTFEKLLLEFDNDNE